MDIALEREAHQPLSGIVDRTLGLLLPLPSLLAAHSRQNPVGLVPCLALACRNDGAERDVEPWWPPKRCRKGAELGDALARRCKRLGINGVNVAQLSAHRERAFGGAAEEQQRVGLLKRTHIRSSAADSIEFAGKVKRSLARPSELHQFEVLRRPAVALGLRTEVAVALLLLVGLTRDDMTSEPSAGEVVEGGDLSRHQCRRNEARPMRHKIAESVGVSGRIKGNEEALGRR